MRRINLCQGWELFKHLATIRLHCRKYLSFPHAAIHDDSTPGPAAQPCGPTGTRRNRNRMRNLTTNPFLLLECQTLEMPDATTHDLVRRGQIRAPFLHRLTNPARFLLHSSSSSLLKPATIHGMRCWSVFTSSGAEVFLPVTSAVWPRLSRMTVEYDFPVGIPL